MKSLHILLAVALAGTVIAATAQAADPVAQKVKPAALNTVNSQYPNSGKVLSTIDTDMYTYIEASGKTDKDPSVWLAITKMKVEKGDAIRYGEGAVMPNYHSKTLNRTFATVIFLEKVIVVK